ncbi:choice-of-anchor D domain-containing protein [candidate division KSB1 bacterium]|nr:choice-of-anchor D domain-containing protein [candidate division KSB1 bacterium]
MAKRAAPRGAALIIAISIITSAHVRAQSKLADSAWPAFRHDTQMTAFIPAKGPVLPEVKWKAQFGSGALGSPVLGLDGTIYVPGNVDSALYAITPDGKRKWTFVGKVKEGELFVAPPIIGQDGKIYLGSTKNIFYAINPNGSKRWSLTLGGAINFSANIGNDGTIYVAAQDCNLYAITPDGNIKWKVNIDRLPANGPAIAEDGKIYVVAGEFLKGFKPDGTLQLEFDNPDMDPLNGLMVEGKKLFYITSLDKPLLRAINNSPRILWEQELDPSFRGALLPALGKDGRIYFPTEEEGGVVALDHNGNKRWIFTVPGALNLTELVVDDSNHVYLVNDKLGLTSVSADGKLRWSLPEVRCAFSPAIGADGTIYVTSDKKLYAIGPQSPFAVNLSKVLGDAQRGCIRSILANPIQVLIKDQYRNPFPNHPVRFRVLSGGGSPVDTTVLTDGAGIAQVFWTLDSLAGEQRLEASSQIGSSPLAGSPQIFAAIAQTPKISGAPALVFDPTAVKNTSEKAYTIRNDSDCNLVINNLEILNDAEGNFALVLNAAQPVNVQPGESLAVSVQYTPQDCNADSATLRISSDDPQTPQFDVTLRGLVLQEPDIEVPNNPIDFGEICRDSAKTLPLPISNTGCVALMITAVANSNPAFRVVNFLPFSIPSGEQAFLNIEFKPTGSILYNDTLSIFSNDPDENPFKVGLRGEGVGPLIALETTPRDSGKVCFGGTATTELCIFNPSACTLRVDSIRFIIHPIKPAPIEMAGKVSSQTMTAPIFIPPNGRVCVTFDVDDVKSDFEVCVRVRSNAINDPAVRCIRWKVIQPVIAGDETVDFGKVLVNTSKQDTARVWNADGCDVIINSLEIKGGNTSAFSLGSFVLPDTLKAADTTGIPIIFAPKREGQHTDTLFVFNNDLKHNPLKIALTGVGGDCPAAISVKPTALQYGDVSVGDTVSKGLAISNEGCDTLRVTDMHNTLPAIFYVNAADKKFNLAPGGQRVVPVFFAPAAEVSYSDNLEIVSNDTTVLVPLNGRGIGPQPKPDIAVEPDSLDFGVVCGPVDSIIVVSNEGEADLRVDSLRFSNTAFSTDHPDSFVVAPGSSKKITVRFTPGSDTTGTLSIFSNDPDTTENPFVVNLHGKGGVPDIAGVSEVKFDTVSAACSGPTDSTRQIYVIRNVGICDLQIDSLTVTGDFSIISGGGAQTIAPNDSANVVLQFAPQAPVAHVDTLRVFSNDSDESPFKVVLRGVGVAVPTIAVEPDTLDFGDVPAGSSKRLTIKITSRGVITLRVDSLVSSCRPVFTTEADEFTLACGEDSSVTVAFSPIVPGPIECTLSIYTNDPGNNPVVVTLLGNGVAGILAVCKLPAPQIACLGDTTDSFQYTLCNVGNAPLTISNLRLALGKAFFLEPPFVKPITLEKDESTNVLLKFAPLQEVEIDTLLVKTDSPLTPDSSLILKGNGSNEPGRIQVSRHLVEFDVPLNETKQEIVKITNDGCQALVITAVDLEADSKYFSFKPLFSLPNTLERRQSLEVMVSFTGYDYGSFTDSLKISSTPVRAATPAFERIRLLGFVKDGVSCLEAPKLVDFGLVSVGQVKVERLALRNCNTQGRLIVEVAQPPKLVEFKVMSDRIEINQGNTQTIDVEFRPINDGLREDMVRFVYYAPSEPGEKDSVTVVLRGAGTGKKAYARPNAFTPNGDRKNDLAKIRFFGYERTAVSLRIFDLRGLEVRYFTSSDVKQDVDEEQQPYYFIGWDGLDVSKQMQLPGAYLWMLEENSKRVASGQIVLIR